MAEYSPMMQKYLETKDKYKEIEKSIIIIQEALSNIVEVNSEAVVEARSKLDYIKYLLKCDEENK